MLIVVQGEHEALYKKTLVADQIHWITNPPTLPVKVTAKIRYRQADQPCFVEGNR